VGKMESIILEKKLHFLVGVKLYLSFSNDLNGDPSPSLTSEELF